MERYDVIVIGGGPAGYTAALYAVRSGFSTLVLEKLSPGGQMALTAQIDNYPGFEEGVEGFALGMKMKSGAERFGAQTRMAEVTGVKLDGPDKLVITAEETYHARAVIAATGADHRQLGLPNEHELIGRGVGYCAACDGMLYRGKTVAVVGGGNSAAADALHLSRICEKVYLIHRRSALRAAKVYHDPLMQAANVTFCWNSVVEEIVAGDKVQAVRLKNVQDGGERAIPVDGVFISIGRSPTSALFADALPLDAAGYIIADESTRTSIPGVFAVGDVRTKAMRQIVTAVGDGATAVHYLEEYLAQQGV